MADVYVKKGTISTWFDSEDVIHLFGLDAVLEEAVGTTLYEIVDADGFIRLDDLTNNAEAIINGVKDKLPGYIDYYIGNGNISEIAFN